MHFCSSQEAESISKLLAKGPIRCVLQADKLTNALIVL